MENAIDILSRYWGHAKFRPNQEEIIQSIIEGRDTLALLPTGGGKSVCFQVPGLMLDGLCLVVSPLIALMKDQVESLRQQNIKAEMVISGMNFREIDRILDNCVFGDIKFLYVSPERLSTELFTERLVKMKINLIAVDEAHCISQWGYDFRPAYLNIAEIRKILPGCPVLALTATATPAVVKDIQKKLLFRPENAIQSSYARSNLAYIVRQAEDKHGQLLSICQKVKGSGIVYANTRKRVVELAQFLKGHGVSCSFYHAGVDSKERADRQEKWKQNHFRVMVATNAFGMGIDKSDVRFVVHMNIPPNPEAYFQEAGRGGRDGNKSYAVLVYNENDMRELDQQVRDKYPDFEDIRKAYRSLWNHHQIAVGAGAGTSVQHHHPDFCKAFNLNMRMSYFSLAILDRAALISLGEAVLQSTKVQFLMEKTDLYDFQIRNPQLEMLIKVLLRSYPGLFAGLTAIDTAQIAKHLNSDAKTITSQLLILEKQQVISYIPGSDKPFLTFLVDRPVDDKFLLPHEIYRDRKKTDLLRLKSIKGYIDKKQCRSAQLLSYFGEKIESTCGICDVCVAERRRKNSDGPDKLDALITSQLSNGPMKLNELQEKIAAFDKEEVEKNIRWRLDAGAIEMEGGRLKLKEE